MPPISDTQQGEDHVSCKGVATNSRGEQQPRQRVSTSSAAADSITGPPKAVRRRKSVQAERQNEAAVLEQSPAADAFSQARPLLSSTAAAAAAAGIGLAAVLILVYLWQNLKNGQLLTPESLRQYDGQEQRPIYLAVLGQVFDVTAGHRHYGKGSGYAHFAGKDASLAFITGNFREDLTDDVSRLTAEQLQSLVGWRDFYHQEYRWIGRLVGRFYDEAGRPTAELRAVETKASSSSLRPEKPGRQQAAPESSSCLEEPGRVSCADGLSHPRQVWTGGGKPACTCFGSTMFSNERRLFAGCPPDANSCTIQG